MYHYDYGYTMLYQLVWKSISLMLKVDFDFYKILKVRNIKKQIKLSFLKPFTQFYKYMNTKCLFLDTGIMRYHVFSKDGVAAWYKCGDKGDGRSLNIYIGNIDWIFTYLSLNITKYCPQ